MDAFQGDLNPLSGRAIFEMCVVPTLLYARESWILTEDMIDFGEFSRRSWKVSGSSNSRFHSALAVHVLLQWPSVQTRVLVRKLIFLKRIMSGDEVVAHVFRTLAAGDVNRIQLGQEENLANNLHISPGFCNKPVKWMQES